MEFDFKKRIERLQEKLKEENFDAIIVATVEGNNKNLYYLSGFAGTAGVLAVSQTDAVLAVDGRYTLRAHEESKVCRIVDAQVSDRRVIAFTNYTNPALEALSLDTHARVGFEASRVSVTMAQAWKESNSYEWVATNFFVESLRQQKDKVEIEHLAYACSVTCNVFVECVQHIVPGISEFEVAKRFDVALREHGALGNSFETIVASGPNSASPHHETGTRALEAGDPVTVDFGGIFKGGYCSDVTRTVFVPGAIPNSKLIEIYKTVLEANKEAFQALKPGMTWKVYDASAREHIAKAGYGEYFTHGLGHSLGLEAHDPYNYAEAPFEEGTVVTDEPGIYVPGLGGIRIEDDLVVTKDGAHSLTPAPYLNV